MKIDFAVRSMAPSVLLGICQEFEEEYGLSSKVFYARYLNNEFDGFHDAARWAGYWRMLLKAVGDTGADVTFAGRERSGRLLSAIGG